MIGKFWYTPRTLTSNFETLAFQAVFAVFHLHRKKPWTQLSEATFTQVSFPGEGGGQDQHPGLEVYFGLARFCPTCASC